jgi:hypothetical protein
MKVREEEALRPYQLLLIDLDFLPREPSSELLVGHLRAVQRERLESDRARRAFSFEPIAPAARIGSVASLVGLLDLSLGAPHRERPARQ